jgi:phasin
MTKTAQKTVEFPSFDATQATDQFRAFTENSVAQGREAYAKLKAGFEDGQKAVEATFENAKAFSDEMTLKSIAAMRSTTEAGFAHVEALVAAKSLSEIVELQSAFARKALEMSVDQAKDFQSLSSKAATDLSKPMKDAVEKSMKELKAA